MDYRSHGCQGMPYVYAIYFKDSSASIEVGFFLKRWQGNGESLPLQCVLFLFIRQVFWPTMLTSFVLSIKGEQNWIDANNG